MCSRVGGWVLFVCWCQLNDGVMGLFETDRVGPWERAVQGGACFFLAVVVVVMTVVGAV